MKKTVALFLAIICVLSMSIVAVSADDFVSSSDRAEVPEILPAVDEGDLPDDMEAEDVAAVIKGDEKTYVTFEDIIQISISEADKYAADKDVDEAIAALSKALIEEYSAFDEGKKDLKDEKSIVDAAKSLGITEPQMAVTDMFEVNLGEHTDKLNKEGASVVLKFANTSKAVQGKLIVAHMVGEEWKAIAKDKVKVTKDTIEVEFDSLCPVMFINVQEKAVIEDTTDAPKDETKAPAGAPQTSADDDKTGTIILVVVICVIVVGTIVAIYFVYKSGNSNAKKPAPAPRKTLSAGNKSRKGKKWSGKRKQVRRQRRSNRGRK